MSFNHGEDVQFVGCKKKKEGNMKDSSTEKEKIAEMGPRDDISNTKYSGGGGMKFVK